MPNVPRPTRKCASTGREILPGEPFRSTLRLDETGWVREDFSLEGWQEPTMEPLAQWETILSRSTRDVEPLQDDVLLALMSKEQTDPRLRFAAASLLMAAKALKLRKISVEDGQEILILTKPRGKHHFRVANPGLSDAELKKWEDAAVNLAKKAAA